MGSEMGVGVQKRVGRPRKIKRGFGGVDSSDNLLKIAFEKVEMRWYSKRCPSAPKLQSTCQKRILIITGGQARLLFITGCVRGLKMRRMLQKLQRNVENWSKKVENGEKES